MPLCSEAEAGAEVCTSPRLRRDLRISQGLWSAWILSFVTPAARHQETGFPATLRTHGFLPRAACTSLSHRALCWLPAPSILSAKAAPSSAWPLATALGSLDDIGLGRWPGTVGVRVLCAIGEAPASDTSLFGDWWVGGHRTSPLLTSGKPSTLHSWPQNRRVGPKGLLVPRVERPQTEHSAEEGALALPVGVWMA